MNTTNTNTEASTVQDARLMTSKEIFALGKRIQDEGGWTKEQYLSHPCYAYSKQHSGEYATKGAYSVYFNCSDSPSRRLAVGGYVVSSS